MVDRNTVVTAAHCYISKIAVTYAGLTYSVTVRTNSYHSTIESAYTVYLGLHNKDGVLDGVSSLGTGVAKSISRFSIVINFFNFN